MPALSASSSATFSSPLRLSFPTTTQGGLKASNLKMVSMGWPKTAFPSLKTSRFRVSCAAKPETVQKVCDIVRKQLALSDETPLTPGSKFSDLGADSLDTVEIVMGLEEEFGISVEEDSSQNISTVQEAADMIEKLVQGAKPEA
ncbi:acyl carrier protein 1, chloroplastic-like [Humulus lupulus]|uniref:acyl carrier protein 1, chloroplastic-like n=1 Tax=Humulus lupulus TaxID=3486 RepID=UPI002B40776B|nr:acyl carrier protein 1, chloroplastic-like [Humulus lupulus]